MYLWQADSIFGKMKLNSRYFDGIRVKPEEDRTVSREGYKCDWSGCDEVGEHPAPKGRGRDGEYYRFCMKHVREYNKSYNYFNGMSDDQVSEYQESAMTGHRPTWKLGENNSATSKRFNEAEAEKNKEGFSHDFKAKDSFGLFNEKKHTSFEEKKQEAKRRPIRNLERKSLKKLNLDETATAEDIKTNFKDLVKKHHPDLNGGDRDSEDRLREIIQAYNYLKQVGLC